MIACFAIMAPACRLSPRLALVLITAAWASMISPVSCILESMCFSPGYYGINPGSTGGSHGPRDTGWNRLYPTSYSWAHSFWVVSSSDGTRTSPQLRTDVNFVKNTDTVILDGWVHLEFVKIPSVIHYFAVWAVNERNEAYGEFVRMSDKNKFKCGSSTIDSVMQEKKNFFSCSAGPANAASVPNMYVYAHLDTTRLDTNGVVMARPYDEDRSLKKNRLNLLWRTPAQTWCQRPEKFRFMIAHSGERWWEDKWCGNWTISAIPSGYDMDRAGEWGPILDVTDWIYPKFYGHASRHDLEGDKVSLRCAGGLQGSKNWVQKLESENLDPVYVSPALWQPALPGSSKHPPDWIHSTVIARSTCQAQRPDYSNYDEPFGGRCAVVTGRHYVSGQKENQMKCSDSASTVGQSEFKIEYTDHLNNFKERLLSNPENCECQLVVFGPPIQYSRLLPIFYPINRAGRVKTLRELEDEAPIFLEEKCDQSKMSPKEQARGGICVHTKVGTLVYGVRQWHGVTSLCVTLLITPSSIFVARYYKGGFMLVEGRVPLRGWYMAHIMLAFPAIWMYASGFATLSRQKDVLGYSLTGAARMHRILGMVTCLHIPFQFLTGFLRPIGMRCRKVVIFLHWLGGIMQHLMELALCVLVSHIPASPTQSKSLYSPEFGTLLSSIVSCLILGWFVFSALVHIGIMIRIKQDDCRLGVGARSVFPIIIPLLNVVKREDVELGRVERDHYLRKGALFLYVFVSILVYTVCVVSLYQRLHDKLYYGYGPMTCTHGSDGSVINSTNSSEGIFCRTLGI